jgi:hypothetical protein
MSLLRHGMAVMSCPWAYIPVIVMGGAHQGPVGQGVCSLGGYVCQTKASDTRAYCPPLRVLTLSDDRSLCLYFTTKQTLRSARIVVRNPPQSNHV